MLKVPNLIYLNLHKTQHNAQKNDSKEEIKYSGNRERARKNDRVLGKR